jgi:hypothetical protein
MFVKYIKIDEPLLYNTLEKNLRTWNLELSCEC